MELDGIPGQICGRTCYVLCLKETETIGEMQATGMNDDRKRESEQDLSNF